MHRTIDSRGFRRNVQGTFPKPVEAIYGRLEADRGGEVSKALMMMKPAHPGLVISYVAQAADLAQSAANVAAQCQSDGETYSKYSAAARELRAFCDGRAPIHLWSPLMELAEFLQSQAKSTKTVPERLQIKRTNKTTSAAPTLALRHLADRLRKELRIKHPPHKAVECFIRVALGLDKEIPSEMVGNALRMKNANSRPRRALKLTNSGNPLKNKEVPGRAAR